MRRFWIILVFLVGVLITQAQVVPSKVLRITNATTALGENIAAGDHVFNIATGQLFIAKQGVISTATLTTASSSFQLSTVTNNNQLTNGAGYITDGNTNWNNSYGFITDGNTNWNNSYGFITSPNDADASPTNEIQTLSIDGHTISLTDGGSVVVPDNNTQLSQETVQDYVGSMVTGNTETGITVTYDDAANEFDFVAADASTTNEIQTLSIVGHTISLTDGGSVVVPDNNTTYTETQLNQDDVTLADVKAAASNDFHNIGGVDANTWRGIDDTPVNGVTGESVSSNWAYDHATSSTAHPRDTRNQIAGTYNTIIGTDTDITGSGSTIVDDVTLTDGVVTAISSRTLTLADLGYTGATNANYITDNSQLANGAGYVTTSNDNDDIGVELNNTTVDGSVYILDFQSPLTVTADGTSEVNIGFANPGYITDGNTGWDNSYGFITDGNTNWNNSYGFITSPNDADASPTNEIQTLSIVGHTISLTDGGSVVVPDNNTTYTEAQLNQDDVTSTDVTTALGYTPYNSTNPAGYITDGNTGWDNSYGFITSNNDDDDIAVELNNTSVDGSVYILDFQSPLTVTADGTSEVNIGFANPGYITDGNTGWDNSYGFITDGNTGWDNTYGFITSQLSQESVQDYVGSMVTGNTETGITVTYDDTNNEFDFVAADASPTNEIQALSYTASTDVISLVNGGSIDITEVDTWRNIDNTATDGATTESISSDWAYYHTNNSQAHPRDTRNQIAGSYAPSDGIGYLVTSSTASLGNEIAVGTSPSGDLGGTWGNISVDDDSHNHTNNKLLSSSSTSGHYSGNTTSFQNHPSTAFTPVYISANNTVAASDASGATKVPCIGITIGTQGDVLLNGFYTNTSWSLTAGGEVYLGTSGGITQTIPSSQGQIVQVLGVAIDANTVYFTFDNTIVEVK